MKFKKLQIFLVIAATAFWSPATVAQTLKIATLAPEGSFWMTQMRAGAKKIDAATEGRVKFKFYGGGVQGNDKQVRRKLRIGQLHGGTFTSTSLAVFQPDSLLYSLPLQFISMEEVLYVRERMDDRLRQLLEDSGYVNFGFASGGFGYLMSNKPMRNLADFEGQKVWLPEDDQIDYEALRALGIAPVVMPMTDVLTGLQTNLLDSVSVSPVGALVLQWHTKLQYITDLPLTYVYAALVLNRKYFEKLSPADQSVVREVMDGIYTKIDAANVTDNEDAMQALIDSGLQKVKPDSGQIPRWREIIFKSNRKMAEQGAFSVELLDELKAHLAEFRSSQVARPVSDQ